MCFSYASWNGASALLAVDHTPDPSGTIGAWHGASPSNTVTAPAQLMEADAMPSTSAQHDCRTRRDGTRAADAYVSDRANAPRRAA